MTTWNLSGTRHHVLICNGDNCLEKGAVDVTRAIRKEIARFNAGGQIHTTMTKCNVRCDDGCNVIVYPGGDWYRYVTPQLGRRIVTEHLLEGNPVTSNLSYTYREQAGFITTPGIPTGVPKPNRKR